ncbi:hypothetical protein H8B02_22945 [Bradyrhizobium sp. Pear77]|uniref:3'-5' exonuclease n=1 Tax=Bradyrhizobium altum TaxID=1571202 RepID=UPI001E3F5D06|nr:3'-5' exonuclease [Bradyrhizobium altum]MCC8956180.1 hypothetical protein [Bradyrhizobium altum]
MESLLSLAIGGAVSCITFLVIIALKRRSSQDHARQPSTPDAPEQPMERTVRDTSTSPSPTPVTADRPALSRAVAAQNAAPQPSLDASHSVPYLIPQQPVPAWHAWSLPSLGLKITPPVTPNCVTFFDVETTGLNSNDRIVTLAAIKLINHETCATRLEAEFMHLVFDPGKKSHPRAEAVHGYSDWLLRHQDVFDDHAAVIADFFNSSDLLVAHNAEFDLTFYNREMERSGRMAFSKETFCTMTAYRERGLQGGASLDAACRKIGIARSNNQHGALEDAWLALRLYLWLKNNPFAATLPSAFQKPPSNLKPTPSLPDGRYHAVGAEHRRQNLRRLLPRTSGHRRVQTNCRAGKACMGQCSRRAAL